MSIEGAAAVFGQLLIHPTSATISYPVTKTCLSLMMLTSSLWSGYIKVDFLSDITGKQKRLPGQPRCCQLPPLTHGAFLDVALVMLCHMQAMLHTVLFQDERARLPPISPLDVHVALFPICIRNRSVVKFHHTEADVHTAPSSDDVTL